MKQLAHFLWVLLSASVFGACASTARMTGDFGDYASYRRTRLAPTFEERLGAADRYLRKYPDGDYRDEVRAWFVPAEKHYFKLAWNNLPRLRAYLDAMPKGPHAEAIVDRIGELESRSAFANQREERELTNANSIQSRLARAAEARREFLHEFSALTGALAKTRSFDEPTSNLDSELLLRFRIRQPAGVCDESSCAKTFSYPFAVPEQKSIVDREVKATLEIALERGLVQSVTLAGPELLTRVAEAVEVSAVPNNPQARAEAIGHAVDVLDDALEPALPKSRCAADAVSPVVLARKCDGVRFEVSYGLDAGTPDRLTIRAEKR
ncbi:MAG TPA: hypothetical protein VGM44_17970 [Polyangiaceae bacterium]